jgi:hypothetical protein
MKVGDLVKWTHPHAKDTGIIIKIPTDTTGWYENEVIIHWFGNPHHSGLYPIDHELLEPLDEKR